MAIIIYYRYIIAFSVRKLLPYEWILANAAWEKIIYHLRFVVLKGLVCLLDSFPIMEAVYYDGSVEKLTPYLSPAYLFIKQNWVYCLSSWTRPPYNHNSIVQDWWKQQDKGFEAKDSKNLKAQQVEEESSIAKRQHAHEVDSIHISQRSPYAQNYEDTLRE